jgi:hypothetical protein
MLQKKQYGKIVSARIDPSVYADFKAVCAKYEVKISDALRHIFNIGFPKFRKNISRRG